MTKIYPSVAAAAADPTSNLAKKLTGVRAQMAAEREYRAGLIAGGLTPEEAMSVFLKQSHDATFGPGTAGPTLAPGLAEKAALAAESQIQGAATQDAREHWQKTADHLWGLA